MQAKGKANLHKLTFQQFIELSHQGLWSSEVIKNLLIDLLTYLMFSS